MKNNYRVMKWKTKENYPTTMGKTFFIETNPLLNQLSTSSEYIEYNIRLVLVLIVVGPILVLVLLV